MIAPPTMRPTILLPTLVPLFLLACSGNAIVEPGAQSSKRAKLAIEKCEPPPPEDGTELKEVYACIPLEDADACPEPGDAFTKTELGYVLNKIGDGCAGGTVVHDVPCGPDLNAPVDCCYVARVKTTEGGCD
jgi:hypothetical protein